MVKSQQLFDRLKQKSCYEKFNKDHPDAYLYAIFCMISIEEKIGDKIQFDFLIPKTKRLAMTEYPFDEMKVSLQEVNPAPEKLDLTEDLLDIEDLRDSVKEAQEKNKDNSSVTKIIAVLKNKLWDITCLTSTVDILRIKIDAVTRQCNHFKKENLTSFIQIKKPEKKN